MPAGDIALVGFGADGKSFAFVVLADMAGQTVFFTDNGWQTSGSFRPGEGVIAVTIPVGTAVGTVITVSSANLASISAATSAGVPVPVTRTGSFDPSQSGDQFIAYTGSAASPQLLFAIDFADSNTSWAANATSSNNSAVPTGLVAGTTALAFGPDNGAYAGPMSGTRAVLLAAIADPANWTFSETSAPAYPGAFTVGGGGTPGTLSVADASVVEGDVGTVEISFTVTRTGGSSGAVGADYAVSFVSANAGDFAPAQALTGTVSFAAGQVSRTITFLVSGDFVNEPDETFAVTLSVPTGGATLGDAEASGTIVNDDAAVAPGTPFINEIHYDNAGGDVGERIEIAAPAGTSLAGWTLVLYNGSTDSSSASPGAARAYSTTLLSGVVPNQDDGYGTLAFTYGFNGIQNGDFDGVALVDPDGNVVQFLSYEGSITAFDGPAAGMTSTDIGVSEGGSSPVGFSLQVTGSGAVAADFTWTEARDDNFGAVNTDQNFIGADATGLVSIGDSSIVEGDSGEALMVFTVSRAGGLAQPASVDWFLGLSAGGADSADLGTAQPLSGRVDFAPGESSVQIAVAIAGDTFSEENDTFSLLLANPDGNISIVDSAATGTILNDDPLDLRIYEIQGEGHRTVYDGQPVRTTGIVTGVVGNGFYLQDPTGDGNARTSDGIFVFTGTSPSVALGDSVSVRGTAEEFQAAEADLSLTEIAASAVTVLSHDNDLPAAVVIGIGGLTPPSHTIDDDGLASYDPATDGIDFYEALEGMRVTIDQPMAVAATNGFGETYVVASGGAEATGVNDRGGITIAEGDYNPEKIQIDANSQLFAGYAPAHSQGDLLGDVTGIVSYSFNSYEVLVTEAVAVVTDVTATRETTTLEGDRDHLTVANYNVHNLSPADSAATFDLLANEIVYSLAAPDIIGLQEMQDGNGLDGSAPLSATVTANLLIAAIAAAGGPNYVYVEVAPSVANSTGGEPGGNIRNGFLYNADRVDFVEGSAFLIEDSAFNGSRRPLVSDFTFNGETVRLINVHFTSRLGSDPLWGENQPPLDAGDGLRTAQAGAVQAYVNNALATDPSLSLGVLGDFNGFYWEDAVGTLEAGGLLTDLHRLLPVEERYTYLFEGSLQALDHLLVSGGLLSGAAFDAVHINAEQVPGTPTGSDHDPIVARFRIGHPNEAPVAVNDSVAVDEDGSTGNLWGMLLGNNTDPDPEDVHAIASVDGSGTYGTLLFDADAQTLVYVADDDSFDTLAPGATFVDSFEYTVTDQHGLTSTATVEVTVTGVDDGVSLSGGNGNDILTGTAGEDILDGGNAGDTLRGLGGHDLLLGGNGVDRLEGGSGRDLLAGGNGNDVLVGGTGADIFLFGRGGGGDVVLDFEAGVDRLAFEDGVGVRSMAASDIDGDGDLDLSIAFSNGGGSVTLLNVSDIGSVGFAGPADLASHMSFF